MIKFNMDKLEVHPWNRILDFIPRLATYELEALTNSIKQYGIKNPILVLSDGRIIDGYHRWLAANKLGMACPFTIVDLDEDDAFALGLSLNLDRRQLSFEQIDEVRGGQRRAALKLRKQGKPQEEVAKIVGVSQRTIGLWEQKESNSNITNAFPIDLRYSIPKEGYKAIHDRAEKGETQKQIAEDYKISRQRVGQIIKQAQRSPSGRITLPEFLKKINPIFYEFSVWEVPAERPEGGRVDYKGNCSPYVCAGCLYNYSREGDVVMDPMAGSGTFLDVAKEVKTSEGTPAFKDVICLDLNPIRPDIASCDAENLDVPPESVDFVFVHFPYWNSVDYIREAKSHGAEKTDEENELSHMSFDKFEKKSKAILYRLHELLKNGRNLCLMIGSKRRKEGLLDLPRLFAEWTCEDEDGPRFALEDKIIVMTYNPKKISFNARGKRRLAIGRGRKNNQLNVNYDEILVLKKNVQTNKEV